MCPGGNYGGIFYLRSMHHLSVQSLFFALLTSSWSGLNTGTTFTSVSLVPFGLWGYYSGIHYWSPQIPAICLGSSSPFAFLNPKTVLTHWSPQEGTGTPGSPVSHTQTLGNQQHSLRLSVWPPPSTNAAFLPLCPVGQGASSNVAPLLDMLPPWLYLRKQTSLSPPMLLWPSTLLYARGMEIIRMLVSDLLLLLQP